jgi:alkylated DNA repair protein alkB family protein 8
VGLSYDTITSLFSNYGVVKGVYPADESGTRVIVSYFEESCAEAAFDSLNGRPCHHFGGRSLHMRYSVFQPPSQVSESITVSLEASDLNIPGLYLIKDFVTAEEEKELIAAVDDRPWHCLAKRRVQHYGYEFCYHTRNINTNQKLGELPLFLSPILERISTFKNIDNTANIDLDQLTVNEYPPGVGLSPHVDTHSAFENSIYSLSLAGPCVMEFRKYSDGERRDSDSDVSSNFLRAALFLPPRSMLLICGEARYAWHHYIPHHKVDVVRDSVIRRATRRVSFTIRKVRKGLCRCEFPQYCDSQK